jgi:alpha-tubulin suppressor-like RCC1 family protein
VQLIKKRGFQTHDAVTEHLVRFKASLTSETNPEGFVTSVATGLHHMAVLTRAGQVVVWGRTSFGQVRRGPHLGGS